MLCTSLSALGNTVGQVFELYVYWWSSWQVCQCHHWLFTHLARTNSHVILHFARQTTRSTASRIAIRRGCAITTAVEIILGTAENRTKINLHIAMKKEKSKKIKSKFQFSELGGVSSGLEGHIDMIRL